MSDEAQPNADVEAPREDDRGPASAEDPDHQSQAAELDERDAGAHEEQVSGDANFRADEDPPGAS